MLVPNNNKKDLVNVKGQIDFTVDKKKLNSIVSSIADGMQKSFTTAMLNAVGDFRKAFKQKLTISLNDKVLESLRGPIVLQFDTKKAHEQVKFLEEKLKKLSGPINKLENINEREKKKRNQTSVDDILPDVLAAKQSLDKRSELNSKVTTPFLKKQFDASLVEARKFYAEIEQIAKGKEFLNATEVKKIKANSDKIKSILTDNITDTKRLFKDAQRAASGSALGGIESSVTKSKGDLKSLGINDTEIGNLTKAVLDKVKSTKTLANQLFDELEKGASASSKKIADLVDKINKGTNEANSLNKTLISDRDNQLNKAISNTEIAQRKIEKAEKEAEERRQARLLKKEKDLIRSSIRESDLQKKAAIIASAGQELLTIKSRVTQDAIDRLNDELIEERQNIAKLGVPLNLINKQTSQYDKTIITLRRDLEQLDQEVAAGSIDALTAAKRYKVLEDRMKGLDIGIRQIDGARIKQIFNLEENDPKQLAFRYGILAFTFNTIGNSLTRLAQTSFQTFSQLAQFAEPIERVNNALNLQIKQGLINVEQRDEALRRLREIGDIPGSSVEAANKTFEQLKRINLSLRERLDLTEGLSKLPSLTGGTPEDANQLANALTKASARGEFEGENFQTVLAQGGEVVQKLLTKLNAGTAKQLNEFGVLPFIREFNKELAKLETPAATTTDRVNRLKSRASEFGIIIGQIVAPGLDKLNVLLRDELLPRLNQLQKAFESLPQPVKDNIGSIAVGVPVVAALSGGLLTLIALLPALKSGFLQLKLFSQGAKESAAAFKSTLGTILKGPKALPIPAGAPFAGIATGAANAAQTTGFLSKLLPLLGRVGGALKNILGLSNPIGIAINLLLSALISFFTNFGGVRDRFLEAFSKLDEAVAKLLKAFGIDNGGLGYLLKKIGDALLYILKIIGNIISTVGGILIEFITSIVSNITMIVNKVTEVINLFKSGSILQAIATLLTGATQLFLSFFQNIVTNIAAFLVDRIKDAISDLIGDGTITGLLDRASFELRKSNNSNIVGKAIKDENSLQAVRVKNQEEINQIIKDRQENERNALLSLREILEKLREDSKKFGLENRKAELGEGRDDISRQRNEAQSNGKFLLSLATTIKGAETSFNKISAIVSKLDKSEIQSIAEEQNLNTLSLIQETLTDEKFKKLFASLVSNPNIPGSKQAIDAKNVALNTKDFNQAVTSFNQVLEGISFFTRSLAQQDMAIRESDFTVGPKAGLSPTEIVDFDAGLIGLRNKVDASIRTGNRAIKNAEEEQRKAQIAAIDDLTAQQNKIDSDQIENNSKLNELKQEGIDQVKELVRQTKEERDAREGVLEVVKKTNAEEAETAKRLDDKERKLREIGDADAKIRASAKRETDAIAKKLSEGLIDPAFAQQATAAIQAQAKASSQVLANLSNQTVENFDNVEAAYKNLYSEKNKTLATKFYRAIREQIILFSEANLKAFESFTDIFSQLNLRRAGSGPTLGTDTEVLIDQLNNLVNSGMIPKFSKEFRELSAVILQYGNAVNNKEREAAFERFVNGINSIKTSEAVKELEKLATEYSNLTGGLYKGSGKDFNINEQLEFLIKPLSSGDFFGKFQDLLNSASFKNRDNFQKLIDKARAMTDEDFYSKALPELFSEFAQEGDKFFNDFIQFISRGESDADKARNSELINKVLEIYKAKIKVDAEVIKTKIETAIGVVDSRASAESEALENKIKEKENELRVVEETQRGATGAEVSRLREQNKLIRFQIINFNAEKLDLEEAYNIQKAVIQAGENKTEIERIIQAGRLRREEIARQRALDLKEAGAIFDSQGNIVDSKGNITVPFKSQKTVTEVPNVTSAGSTNQTTGGDTPDESSVYEKAQERIKEITDALSGVGDAAVQTGDAVLEMFNKMASGEGVITKFKALVGGMKITLKSLGETFQELAKFAITAFAQSLAQAITDSIVNGDNFLKSLGKLFGQILITLGTAILQIGIVALAIGILSKIPFFGFLDPTGGSIVGGAIATAAGIGLIAAGKALGGGGSTSAANTSNTGATNAANSAAGNSGDAKYDPEKDPKMVYQKALMSSIYIDIRRDDASMVKTLIKQVNRNPRLGNLVGNARTGLVI